MTGIKLLTTLISDIYPPSKDMPHAQKQALSQKLRSIAEACVDMLEVGARMAGPFVPNDIPVSAVRAMGSLTRFAPTVTERVMLVLGRCLTGRYDPVGREILSVLADIYSGRVVNANAGGIGAIVAVVVEDVAMGRTVTCSYFTRLIAVVEELVMRRLEVERLLNAFMGITKRCVVEKPAWTLGIVDAWLAILDVLEEDGAPIGEKVCVALSGVCVGGCVFATNGDVLRKLSWGDIDSDADTMTWEQCPDLVPEVVATPEYSAILFVTSLADIGELIDDDEGDGVAREHYVAKLVECIVATSRLSPTVAKDAATFAVRVMRETVNSGCKDEERLGDMHVGAALAFGIGGIAAGMPPEICRGVLEAVVDVLSAGAWRTDIEVGVALFRCAGVLVPVLKQADVEYVRRVGEVLVRVANEALSESEEKVCLAACVALLCLDRVARKIVFASVPPVDVRVVETSKFPGVVCMAVGGFVRWCVVPPRTEMQGGGILPVKWGDEEWGARRETFGRFCDGLFARFDAWATRGDVSGMDEVAKGTAMLRVITKSVHGVTGEVGNVVWSAVVKRVAELCERALRKLMAFTKEPTVQLDVRDVCLRLVAGIVGAIDDVCRCFRRRVTAEMPSLGAGVVNTMLEIVGGSDDVARETLRLVRGQLEVDENVVGAAVRLAANVCTASNGEGEVCVAAVGVLGEAVRGHWLSFWPGDHARVVRDDGGDNQGAANGRAKATAEMTETYFCALRALVAGVKSRDLSVCRAALEQLQSINAIRRLFARTEAFVSVGAGREVMKECLVIIGLEGGRENLKDEGMEVLWGVANADWQGLQQVVSGLGGDIDVEACPKDRGGFGGWIEALVGDFVYWGGVRAGPVL